MKKQYAAYYLVNDEQVIIQYCDTVEEARACLEAQKEFDAEMGFEKDFYGITVED